MHPALMFSQEVRALYTRILSDKGGAVALKVQVLKNLQTYLQEEDSRMLEADRDCEPFVSMRSNALVLDFFPVFFSLPLGFCDFQS